MHDSEQSATRVLPSVVQNVSVPSEPHEAIVPEHGGKHVRETFDVVDARSAQGALSSARRHASVTRRLPYERRHSGFVSGWAHSSMRRAQRTSSLIGFKLLLEPVAPEPEEPELVPLSAPGGG